MPPRRVSFEWSLRRDGNDGYVLEFCPGTAYRREFGPMPPHAVPAFATARRRLIAMYMERLGANYVMETPEQFFHDAVKPETAHAIQGQARPRSLLKH